MLIKDPEDPKKFYPRFNIDDTSSFRDLDQHRYKVNLPVKYQFLLKCLKFGLNILLVLNIVFTLCNFSFLFDGKLLDFSFSSDTQKIPCFSSPPKKKKKRLSQLMGFIMMQQRCSQKAVLWLLLPTARKSLASKCNEHSPCSSEFIRYAGLWGRSWLNSFLCSSCKIS